MDTTWADLALHLKECSWLTRTWKPTGSTLTKSTTKRQLQKIFTEEKNISKNRLNICSRNSISLTSTMNSFREFTERTTSSSAMKTSVSPWLKSFTDINCKIEQISDSTSITNSPRPIRSWIDSNTMKTASCSIWVSKTLKWLLVALWPVYPCTQLLDASVPTLLRRSLSDSQKKTLSSPAMCWNHWNRSHLLH